MHNRMQKYVSHLLFLKSISKRGGGVGSILTVDSTSVLAVQRPFYISISISILPTQHTTFIKNLYFSNFRTSGQSLKGPRALGRQALFFLQCGAVESAHWGKCPTSILWY